VTAGSSARIAWFATGGTQTERDRPAPPITLPLPDWVRAVRGRGQVTVDWSPVAGDAGWARLHEADRLELLEPPRLVRDDGGCLELAFELPMPAMSLIELVPA
jgi:hypothetical protein